MFENAKNNIINLFKRFRIYIVVAIVGLALGFFLSKNMTNNHEYETIVQNLQESHKKELEEIQKATEEERKKYEENERKYKERMALIEKDYNESKSVLKEQKVAEVINIVKSYSGKPDQLAERFAKVTGFKVILPGD